MFVPHPNGDLLVADGQRNCINQIGCFDGTFALWIQRLIRRCVRASGRVTRIAGTKKTGVLKDGIAREVAINCYLNGYKLSFQKLLLMKSVMDDYLRIKALTALTMEYVETYEA